MPPLATERCSPFCPAGNATPVGLGDLPAVVEMPCRSPARRGSSGAQEAGRVVVEEAPANALGTKPKEAEFPPPPSLLSNVSLFELICITCFNFPYGFICGTFGLWILPAEALRLFPETQSLTLGLSLGIVGVSQLVCPIAGTISDLHPATSQFSKRRPYILGGSIVAFIATFGMRWTSLAYCGRGYYFFLFVGMTSLNITYAVQCGLVPDVLDESVQGRSSALVAVHTLLGSASGFGLMTVVSQKGLHNIYFLYVVLVVLTCALTCWVATVLERRLEAQHQNEEEAAIGRRPLTRLEYEPPCPTAMRVCPNQGHADLIEVRSKHRTASDASDTANETAASLHGRQRDIGTRRGYSPIVNAADRNNNVSLNWSHIVRAFRIDVSESYDFFWVFRGRALYYVGVSVQAFMLYFLRDVVGTPTEEAQRFRLGCIALLAQFTAAAVAYPVGAITDKHSLGKKPLIYLACGSMSAVYVGFLCAPAFGTSAFQFILAAAAVYGAGNGCFLAADYALALATLPNKENTTQALGIWGVAAFIGSAVGPLIWGAVIEACGRDPITNGYLFRGYVAMLLGGVTATVLAAGVIALVRKAN